MLNFAEQTGSGAVMLVWSYPPVLVQLRHTNGWPTWRQNKKVARYSTFFHPSRSLPRQFFSFHFSSSRDKIFLCPDLTSRFSKPFFFGAPIVHARACEFLTPPPPLFSPLSLFSSPPPSFFCLYFLWHMFCMYLMGEIFCTCTHGLIYVFLVLL